MKYDDYITEFLYCSKNFDTSFVKYKHDETEKEKEDIILFFCKHFPEYKFKNSYPHTAFLFKKINNTDESTQ